MRLALLVLLLPALAAARPRESAPTGHVHAPGRPTGTTEAKDPELLYLLSCLEGHFTSEAGNGLDLRLDVVRIWPSRPDGPWLYAERARASDPGQPGSQRVMRLSRREDGTLVVKAWSIPDRDKWAGEWRRFEPLVALSPDDLLTDDACELELTFHHGVLGGPSPCPADLVGGGGEGAQVVVRPDRLEGGAGLLGVPPASARPTRVYLKAPPEPTPRREMRPGH